METDELINANSFVICKDCAEDFDLKEIECDSSEKCIVCDWPINRKLTKENIKKFLEGIKSWLKENSSQELREKIEKKLKFLENKEISICRYDFFLTVKEIIESENEELGRNFEKILKAFDFEGSLIS
ncbi:MAG: hypothetical protein QW609_03765 [Candidatus Aenigmatarchaeota archaeon]